MELLIVKYCQQHDGNKQVKVYYNKKYCTD